MLANRSSDERHGKAVRDTLAGINPNLTVVQFQTFNEQIADRFTEERMISRLTTLFGALALLLAIIGLVWRDRLFRRAADSGDWHPHGAGRGARRCDCDGDAWRDDSAALGLAIGIPVALLCVRFVKSQLYEITSADFNVMAGAIVTLALAAFIAGIIPARRAASINPVRALRMD